MTYFLQDLFIAILRPFTSIAMRIDDKKKNIIRVFCFTTIFLLCIFSRVYRGVNYEYYNYYTLVCCVIMFIIMVLSLDKKMKRLEWNKPLGLILLFLFLLMAASEWLTPKSQSYIELIIIFFFGGLAFVWNNCENRERLWNNVFTAIKASFWLVTIISFLFRPIQEGCRYSGLYLNPNSAAYHLLPVIAVYICSIDNLIRTKQTLKKGWDSFLGLGVAMFLLFMSQSRTSFFSIFIMVIAWFALRFYISRKEKKQLLLFKYMAMIIFTVAVSYPICHELLETLPKAVNHPIVFDNDQPYRIRDFDYFDEKEEVKAPSKGNASLLSELKKIISSKFVDKILSGRLTVYKAYMSRLNWKGHEEITLQVDDNLWTSAHNNILQFAYIYGKLTIVPYILLIFLVLAYSFVFLVKNYNSINYAMLPFVLTTGFAVNTMFEAVFQPFHRFTAFIFWIIIGELLFYKSKSQTNEFRLKVY